MLRKSEEELFLAEEVEQAGPESTPAAPAELRVPGMPLSTLQLTFKWKARHILSVVSMPAQMKLQSTAPYLAFAVL
jgi:hypothetical protein